MQERGSNSWASYKGTKPDWVRDGKVIILKQVGLKRAVDLPNVPLLQELATNEEDRAAMRLCRRRQPSGARSSPRRACPPTA